MLSLFILGWNRKFTFYSKCNRKSLSFWWVRGRGSNFLLNAVHLVNELQRKQEWKQR